MTKLSPSQECKDGSTIEIFYVFCKSKEKQHLIILTDDVCLLRFPVQLGSALREPQVENRGREESKNRLFTSLTSSNITAPPKAALTTLLSLLVSSTTTLCSFKCEGQQPQRQHYSCGFLTLWSRFLKFTFIKPLGIILSCETQYRYQFPFDL